MGWACYDTDHMRLMYLAIDSLLRNKNTYLFLSLNFPSSSTGHYEGQVPIHFGFQVEHPRLQYPAKSSFADKYHQDHHIPTVPNHHIADKYHQDHHIPTVPKTIKIPKVPIKTPPAKYNPSVEDVDDDIESDFKHIKIKKYSTNNDELPIPSTYNAR
jgi:hypothetical protein